MDSTIKIHSKEIICPIDGKRRTIYLRTLIYDNKEFTTSNGCDNVHGHTKCHECIANEATIIDLAPIKFGSDAKLNL